MFGEFYRDAGVGYGVELDNAAFADYSMARVIMLYRTFGGDTPPSQIKKCFPIVPIPSTESGPRIQGEWQGTSTEQDSDQNTGTSMDVRIVQKGNRLYGSLVQTDEGQQAEKSRWEVEGRILDNKVTFMKRNAKRTLVGVSYVAPYTPDARELSGTCFSGLAKGTWTLRYVGEFNDSAEDMLNPATANPPDKP
jgi:hypothetical protein